MFALARPMGRSRQRTNTPLEGMILEHSLCFPMSTLSLKRSTHGSWFRPPSSTYLQKPCTFCGKPCRFIATLEPVENLSTAPKSYTSYNYHSSTPKKPEKGLGHDHCLYKDTFSPSTATPPPRYIVPRYQRLPAERGYIFSPHRDKPSFPMLLESKELSTCTTRRQPRALCNSDANIAYRQRLHPTRALAHHRL